MNLTKEQFEALPEFAEYKAAYGEWLRGKVTSYAVNTAYDALAERFRRAFDLPQSANIVNLNEVPDGVYPADRPWQTWHIT